MKYSINIPGDPIAQKRHRDFSRFNRVIKYDPCYKQKQDFAKKVILFNVKCHQDPVEVELIFGTSIKPSISNKERNERLWGVQNDSHIDIDNLCKFTLDACNGVLWSDDSIITSLKCSKIYSENPFTKICIMEKNKLMFNENKRILSHISPKEYQELINDCEEISNITVDPIEEFLEGLGATQSASADTLIKFINKNFKLFQKLHKEISKWSKDGQNG